ncbi:uncharacterized protein [Clytia hemisphaerica]
MKLPKEIVTTPQKPNNNKDFEDEEESPFNSISPKRCAESSKESPEKISTYSTSTSTSTNKKLNMNMSEEEESQTQFNFPSPKIRKVSKDDQQRESSNISQSQTSSKFINQVNVEDLTNKDFENIARIFSNKKTLSKSAILADVTNFKQLRLDVRNMRDIHLMAESVGRQLVEHRMVIIGSCPVTEKDDVILIAK